MKKQWWKSFRSFICFKKRQAILITGYILDFDVTKEPTLKLFAKIY